MGGPLGSQDWTIQFANVALAGERILTVGTGDKLAPLIGERTVAVGPLGKMIVLGLIKDIPIEMAVAAGKVGYRR